MASGAEVAPYQGTSPPWIASATMIVTIVVDFLASVVEPPFRGFFCDDWSIAFPARRSTVPDWALVFACLVVPLTAVNN